MAMCVPIYLVVKGSGQVNKDGVEYQLILEAKLTRGAADEAARKHEGATVRKMVADKEISIQPF